MLNKYGYIDLALYFTQNVTYDSQDQTLTLVRPNLYTLRKAC